MPFLVSVFCACMLAEGMWEPGSWEWGASALAVLVLGLLWNNWNWLVSKVRKPTPVEVDLGNVSFGALQGKLSVEPYPPLKWYQKPLGWFQRLWRRLRS